MKRKFISNNEQRDSLLNRMAALTLQTCMLNGASLLASGCSALLMVIYTALTWSQFLTAAATIQRIYSGYLLVPQFAVVIFSSNIAFVVHCCYSKMYREAVQETYAELKKHCKRAFAITSHTWPQTNKVHPEQKNEGIIRDIQISSKCISIN